MVCKFVVLAAVVAVARAGIIAAPVASSYSSVTHHHGALAYAAHPVAAVAAPVAYAYHAPAPIVKVAAPVVKTIVKEVAVPDAPAHYDFEYGVNDATTGDVKTQKESRDGDSVTGMYSVVQPDGSTRIVEYTANDKDGFNAVVKTEAGPAPAPEPVKKEAATEATPAPSTEATIVKYHAPLLHHAPLVHHAPLAYHAPIVKYHAPLAYHAPVVKYHAPVASYHHVAPSYTTVVHH